MTPLTLDAALRLPAFLRASPVVLAAHSALHRPLRWAHATERTDLHNLLRPGDLLLTMGTGLPDDSDEEGLAGFARDLADIESAGVVIELGNRWQTDLPPGLVAACEASGVPLVILRHETRFAELAQSIGEQVVDAQLAELREAHRVHETFTELSFTQADPKDILRAVQRLTNGPVVLENGQGRPLDYLAGPEDVAGYLEGWQARSSRVRVPGRTGWDPANGWLVTRLGAVDQGWGRLVIAAPAQPSQRLIAVAERAAAALALHRLHDRDRGNLMRRVHREILHGLRADPTSPDVRQRAELAGFPLRRRKFIGLAIRPSVPVQDPDRFVDIAASVIRAADAAGIAALVSEIDREILALLSFPRTAAEAAATERLAAQVHSHHDVTIAAGRVGDGPAEITLSLTEARLVADAVPGEAGSGNAPVLHRLEDLHLRGLLALLGDDERVRLFVDRELAPLRRHDEDHDASPGLVATVRALVLHPASKAAAAASLHLSRAAFYDRLSKIERLLGVDLDDPDVRVSLHVAIVHADLTAARR